MKLEVERTDKLGDTNGSMSLHRLELILSTHIQIYRLKSGPIKGLEKRVSSKKLLITDAFYT